MFLGLLTITGLARRGYFIPYSMASTLPPGAARTSYPVLETAFGRRGAAFAAFAERMAHYRAELLQFACGPAPAPRLDQDWFPSIDALAAYTTVKVCRPRKIFEIGGGHSTRIFVQATEDTGANDGITVVDPEPRRALRLLAEAGKITLHPCPLQGLGRADLPLLGPGDVLSLDGSHILMPGSDADVVLNRILPSLPPGALIHFHDIFLPDPYPESWAWRGYNEQQGVAALLAGGAVDVLFAARYVTTRMPDLILRTGLDDLPVSRAPASSLWLRWPG